jgi:hypothetical protein
MCCEEEEGQAVQGSDRDNGKEKIKVMLLLPIRCTAA